MYTIPARNGIPRIQLQSPPEMPTTRPTEQSSGKSESFTHGKAIRLAFEPLSDPDSASPHKFSFQIFVTTVS
jgi:hypothetical protein